MPTSIINRAVAFSRLLFTGLLLVAAHENRLLTINLRVELFQIGDFGQVVSRDIEAAWMKRGIILVIGFGGIECLQRLHLGYNRARKNMRLVEFRDIGLGGALLGVARGENLGAVLGAL